MIKNLSYRNTSLFIVFFTGWAALSYQLLWIRELGLYFGTHTLSTATVLSVFMAGLSVGAYFFGKWADKIKTQKFLFAGMQAFLALFSLLFNPMFDMIKENTGIIFHSGQLFQLRQFISCFALLFVPASVMGGSLPVLAKISKPSVSDTAKSLAGLYSMNNLGAFLGGILTGFFLIKQFGSILPSCFIGTINMLLVFVALIFLPGKPVLVKEAEIVNKTAGEKKIPGKNKKLALWIIGIEGFSLMAYEVLWTRILVDFSYDKSCFLYSSVILSFLFGMAGGSFLIRKKADKFKNLTASLAKIEISAALISLFLFVLFSYLAPLIIQNRPEGGSWFLVSGREYLSVFILLLIPSSLMGMTFPIGAKLLNRSEKSLGEDIGKLGFLDTIGSVIGPFITGFVLLKFFGVYYSFLIIAGINLIPSVFLLHFSGNHSAFLKFSIATPLILILLLLPGNYKKHKSQYFKNEKMLGFVEGQSSTVRINKDQNLHKSLVINGAHTAFTNIEDMRVHVMLAELPYLFSTRNDKALVIGYGMGVTAKCLKEQECKEIDIAEISPEVIQISNQHFAHLNYHVSEKENVRLILEDGRSWLTRTTDKYDIITTNAVHPRLGPNLYTKEFYHLCTKKMHSSSVICQWIPTNWMSENQIKSLIRAFTEVFPGSVLYYINRSHTLLLGSMDKLPDLNDLNFKLDSPIVIKNLSETGIRNKTDFQSRIISDGSSLLDYTSNIKPNSDHNPVVEFSFYTDRKPNILFLSGLIGLGENSADSLSADEKVKQRMKQHLRELNQFIMSYE